jgi:uncharacterized protein YjbI with pentapeptide repeats
MHKFKMKERINFLLVVMLFSATNVAAANNYDLQKLKDFNERNGCDLRDADLRNLDLSNAKLIGADLTGADLTNINLSNSNLAATNLSWSVLNGTILIGANLDGAALANSQTAFATMRGATICYTIMPDGKPNFSRC